MSTHRASLEWHRETNDFVYQTYNRDHQWVFDGGIKVTASASPYFLGNPACVDPEEAFVASLASCHMLTFLAIAAKKRFVVNSYSDQAVGYLEKNAAGQYALTEVTLKPKIDWGGERTPSAEELKQMHDGAHHQCFIANSVKTEVNIESQ